jgi:hypothetical protein
VTEQESPATIQYQTGAAELTLPGVAVVGVKLLGLYALLSAIPHIGVLPLAFPMLRATCAKMSLSYALPAAAYLAAAVLLLFGAEWVVARILRVRRGGVPPTALDQRFQAMALSLLGVLLVVWGAAGLARAIAEYVIQRGLNDPALAPEPNYSMLLKPAFELLGGVALFLGGRGMAGLWDRMRYGGIQPREDA